MSRLPPPIFLLTHRIGSLGSILDFSFKPFACVNRLNHSISQSLAKCFQLERYAAIDLNIADIQHHATHHLRHDLFYENDHLAQLIMAYFGDGRQWGLKLDYSIEDKPLSTIGPLKLIEDLPDDFLVMNGDVLTDLDFGEFYRTHLDSEAIATVATYERDVKIDFGVLEYSGDNRIVGFCEKPIEHFSVSMGVNAFSRRILDLVPEHRAFGFDDLMLALIKKKCDVQAYPFGGYWLDIGRPDDYDRANAEFDAVRDRLLPSLPVQARRES